MNNRIRQSYRVNRPLYDLYQLSHYYYYYYYHYHYHYYHHLNLFSRG